MAIFASMIAITVVTPTFLLAMMPIFAVYIAVTNYYRNVARELKRLDSISRSPIYAHFSETLGGLPVIRSYLRQKMYRRVNEVKLDDNIAAYYAMKAVDRWLSVRLEVLGDLFSTCCPFMILFLRLCVNCSFRSVASHALISA
jgi:ATP-binding cassette, subfamily C (CFTR/MRP), member 1